MLTPACFPSLRGGTFGSGGREYGDTTSALVVSYERAHPGGALSGERIGKWCAQWCAERS